MTGGRKTGRALVGSLLALLILSYAGPVHALSGTLDALWQDRNPVPRGECLHFLVKAWPYKVYRGRTSPHDCLVKAIRDYRNGDHEEAMGWLQAAFCPDREAQQNLVKQAPAVLDYLLTTYGSEVG
ncbi:MAG: hypothetical protein KGO52_04670 [Nitrospirota bacterium]|nr:hypothetical protein [Nitrospirota bacterium]MDE3119157.1 hypothetical protein [Nitrospirota bacterium]MDE3223940.1 hypothetical protein [Nitrospirota bacterium]MDE3242000.1 hypothetical protein [Nitrospirota bacterium]